MDKKDYLVIIVSIIMAVIGSFILYYATTLGPWTMVDTVDYFDVTRNLSHGYGLVITRPSGYDTPMTIHPPLYSIVLTLGLMLNIQLLEFARLLNIFLFVVLILVLILGTYRHIHSIPLSLGLGFWVLTNHAIFKNYTAALSEPLFLTLGFVSIYLIFEYINTTKSWMLIVGALLAGLSLATRYSGAAFLVAGFSSIFLFQKTNWGKKTKDLLIYTLLSCGPILTWIAYLRINFPGSNPGGYERVENIWDVTTPFRLTYIKEFWNWLGLGLVSNDPNYRIQLIIITILLLVLGIAIFLSARVLFRETKSLSNDVILLGTAWSIFAIASTAILLFSYVFVYAPKPWLDERLYSPIQMGTVIAILIAIYYCSSKLISKPYQGIPVLVLVVLMSTASIPNVIHTMNKLHNNGEGYTSKFWNDQNFIDQLQTIPVDQTIITNDPGAIFFFLGQTSVDLIPIIEHTETNVVPSIIQSQGAYVVLFEKRMAYQIRERYGDGAEGYIQKITSNLTVVYKGNIGTIYYVK
ncbi:MAG: hypothetical protein U0Z26_06310 [Anaerolineales bacterium]